MASILHCFALSRWCSLRREDSLSLRWLESCWSYIFGLHCLKYLFVFSGRRDHELTIWVWFLVRRLSCALFTQSFLLLSLMVVDICRSLINRRLNVWWQSHESFLIASRSTFSASSSSLLVNEEGSNWFILDKLLLHLVLILLRINNQSMLQSIQLEYLVCHLKQTLQVG